jgi:hypothetical protein
MSLTFAAALAAAALPHTAVGAVKPNPFLTKVSESATSMTLDIYIPPNEFNPEHRGNNHILRPICCDINLPQANLEVLSVSPPGTLHIDNPDPRDPHTWYRSAYGEWRCNEEVRAQLRFSCTKEGLVEQESLASTHVSRVSERTGVVEIYGFEWSGRGKGRYVGDVYIIGTGV